MPSPAAIQLALGVIPTNPCRAAPAATTPLYCPHASLTCCCSRHCLVPRYCEQGHASSDHTTLLLNCYTKLKDVAKLDAFIQARFGLCNCMFFQDVSACRFKDVPSLTHSACTHQLVAAPSRISTPAAFLPA